MGKRDNARIHTCGSPMQRLPTLSAPAQFSVTGRAKVLQALNKEGEYDLPTQPGDRPRMEAAMAKGLDQSRPVIGRGF